LAPQTRQKLEVSFNTRFLFFRQDFQIVLDGVCLESGISKPELSHGKAYSLPDGKSVEVKFLGNKIVVWQDGKLVSLNHIERNHQVDP
jgi:hypothetical protein